MTNETYPEASRTVAFPDAVTPRLAHKRDKSPEERSHCPPWVCSPRPRACPLSPANSARGGTAPLFIMKVMEILHDLCLFGERDRVQPKNGCKRLYYFIHARILWLPGNGLVTLVSPWCRRCTFFASVTKRLFLHFHIVHSILAYTVYVCCVHSIWHAMHSYFLYFFPYDWS